jgi:lipid II:glycine glycyltransferase (peptidoglycan interpeptide bridge formation enzyme)
MVRRQSRGEAVSARITAHSFVAYTRHGAGELFQAMHDGKVLSSILVLLAERGGYYQSAGTSPAGMACGASHFLVYEIAQSLQNRAIELFNLGGTEPQNAGLARFKAGFGTTTVALEAATFFLGSPVQRRCIMMARLLRHGMRFKGMSPNVHPLWGKRRGDDS